MFCVYSKAPYYRAEPKGQCGSGVLLGAQEERGLQWWHEGIAVVCAAVLVADLKTQLKRGWGTAFSHHKVKCLEVL